MKYFIMPLKLFVIALLLGSCHANTEKYMNNDNLLNYIGEVEIQVKKHGVDYDRLVKESIAGNEASLIQIFGLGAGGLIDGSGSAAHGEVLLHILEVLGDEKFSESLNKTDKDTQMRVVSHIHELWTDRLIKRYPITMWRSF